MGNSGRTEVDRASSSTVSDTPSVVKSEPSGDGNHSKTSPSDDSTLADRVNVLETGMSELTTVLSDSLRYHREHSSIGTPTEAAARTESALKADNA
jgi:hypothetical protein